MGTIVRRVDVDKIMRQTHIMLRMLLCFDVFFLVSTIVQMVWMSPAVVNTNNNGQWDLRFLTSEAYLHGYCMLSLFTTSLVCNSLACAGVTNNKRMLLLPWLIVYMGFKILLLLLMLLVMSAWRHMQVVFIVMGLPRPASGSDRESVVTAEKANGFPPKYEDVTEKPPKYDEATMSQTQ